MRGNAGERAELRSDEQASEGENQWAEEKISKNSPAQVSF